MKYNELHRLLRGIGCYPTGKQIAGHPAWLAHLQVKHFRQATTTAKKLNEVL